MKFEGAIIFIVVFIVIFGISLSSELPPGKQIYDMFGVPETSYPVLGIPVITLVPAVFNGLIYAVIVWFIFTLLRRPPKQKTTFQQKRS